MVALFAQESKAGVDLEGRPVEGLAELALGVEQAQLRLPKRSAGCHAVFETPVEATHQLGSGFVVGFPEGADDIVCTGTQESPREANQSLTRIGSRAAAVTGRDGDEARMDRVLDDFARMEFE